MPVQGTSAPLEIAAGAATDRLQRLHGHAVFTMPAPWALVSNAAAQPLHLAMTTELERDDLEAIAAAVPDGVRVAVGVGAGTALETAKFVAATRGLELLQIPTAVSSDAAFTTSYRYREHGHTRRGGEIVADEVVIDPLVVLQAPPDLNRAGVGDLLACHTALYEWRLAARFGTGPAWDAAAAAEALRLLDELEGALGDVAAVTVEGIEHLARAHRALAALRQRGQGRAVEGSEHALADAIQRLAPGRLIHGRLVAMCTLAIAHLQGNDPGRAARIITGSMIDAAPAAMGIDGDLFRRALRELVEPAPGLTDELYRRVVEVTG